MINRQRDRQWPRAACTGVRVLVPLLGIIAAASPGQAQVDVAIAVSDTVADAPVTLTLTASVAGFDPVIAYRWTGLDAAPRCARSRCELHLPVASCRRVGLEVTTLLGETATATTSICANDQGEAPPSIDVRATVDGARLTFDAIAHRGVAEIVSRRVWIDELMQVELRGQVELTDGCHAIDGLVIDAMGRVGFDRQIVCVGKDVPEVWLGATPGACPTIGQRHRLCAEAEHPLGAAVQRVDGDAPIGDCGGDVVAPTDLRRMLVRGRDDNDIESFGSVFACTAPDRGPARLVFAGLPDEIVGRVFGPLAAELSIYGGAPPFEVRATFTKNGRLLGTSNETTLQPKLTISLTGLAVVEGEHSLAIQVTDERGLTARVQTLVHLEPGGNSGVDGGVPARGYNSSADGAAACTAATPDSGELVFFCVLFGFALRRRRR